MNEDSQNQTPDTNQPKSGESTTPETKSSSPVTNLQNQKGAPSFAPGEGWGKDGTDGPSAQPISPPPSLHNDGTPEQTPATPPPSDTPPVSPVTSIQNQALEASIIEALRTVFDPEIPVNIYDMGLIYNIAIDADNKVDIRMTLTSPMCPVAGTLPPEVEQKVRGVHGVKSANVELVWDPPWDQEMMSEAAKVTLGFF